MIPNTNTGDDSLYNYNYVYVSKGQGYWHSTSSKNDEDNKIQDPRCPSWWD